LIGKPVRCPACAIRYTVNAQGQAEAEAIRLACPRCRQSVALPTKACPHCKEDLSDPGLAARELRIGHRMIGNRWYAGLFFALAFFTLHFDKLLGTLLVGVGIYFIVENRKHRTRLERLRAARAARAAIADAE
jgi:hypothetical protein